MLARHTDWCDILPTDETPSVSDGPLGPHGGPRPTNRRGLAALLAVATLVTCTDHSTGPAGGGRGSLAIRPTFSSPVNIAAFGLTIDSLRVRVTRPVDVTVFAGTFFFDPTDDTLQLSLPVQLIASVESLAVHLEFLAGSRVLFAGSDTVVVAVGAPDTTATADVALAYVGPGAGITTLTVAPQDSVVTLGGSVQFRVSAAQSGVPVDSFYVSWSTSDVSVATVNASGILTAPPARGVLFVRAVTPNGVTDSTLVTFVPQPTSLIAVSGVGQSQPVGAPLPLPLRVRVTAGDGLGVKGILVLFVAPAGGAVANASVVTDTGGYAQTTATLGSVVGTQTFQASAGSLGPVPLTQVATPGPISPLQSIVTVSSPTVASGATVTLTLLGKDAFGNNLTTGGATVVFTRSTGPGVSTGTIGTTTDNGNGTYSTTFTGALAGTATTIGATIGGSAVTSTLPQLSVTAGAISTTTSVVSVASATVASGTGVTLTLQAKDVTGNNLTIGGATVAFTAAGGTSTGTIGATTDNGNGTYSATFTGAVAGTATTIGATIGGSAVTTTLPTLTVIPGTISTATSVVSVASGTVASGSAVGLTLQARDAAGNTLTTGGATVVFTASGGTSTGTIGTTTDNGDGTYGGTFNGALAGTATTIGATIGGSAVTSTLPTVTVLAGTVFAGTSVVSVSSGTVASGSVVNLTLQARDAAGNSLATGGANVVFSASGGTSTGTIGATTDNGNGTYSATFTGAVAGTATTIGATIGGSAVTMPLPTITVGPGAISAATSVVTTSSGTVASGAIATLTLQTKDAAGNTLTTGGATVVFTASGGTSTGAIGTTSDNGDGTYGATFTGALTGTATTIGATINGAAVTTPLPTIMVVAGNSTTAQSIITVSASTVASGGTVTLTLQARDSAGNNLTAGGLTVVFGNSGGTSTGTIGGTTDNGDGTYTATFTSVLAGTATTIGATINAAPVTSTLPTITVTPGAASTATSLVSVSSPTVVSGAPVTLTLQAKDAAGNDLTSGGATVVFSNAGGTSTGTIGSTTDNGTGTYTAIFAGAVAGTATTIGATINGSPVTSTLPTVTVTPGAISSATSFITVSDSVLLSGAPATLTLQAKDAAGNNLVTGGAVVVFTATGGTSDGTIAPSPATDNGNGTYTATYTGTTPGTEDSIGATVNGVAVTTALPTIRVLVAQTVHSADIITNEAWTAAQNPHVVTGYLRIRNGATLTIEDGAEVRFDAAAGLQVGDTTLGQTGGLVMQGTPGSITLTANTGSPTPGFWRGIEVQDGLAVPAWTNVLIEWAGGARPLQTPTTESCVLIVNDQGQPLVMDGVTIRQCVHAGIHLFGGNLAVHRSRIDSVTGSGIHVDFQGRLQLDSTRIVGSGQEGLLVASPTAGLTTNEFNKFLGNGLASVRLYASQLRGFKQQDSIAGNGFLPGGFGDSIVVAAGLVDGGGTGFRIFAQAAPYLVTGPLKIIRAPVILMPGLVMAFDPAAALQFGDSTPGNEAELNSQGTIAKPVLLTNRPGTPGWPGLFLGRQSGADTLTNVHVDGGGYIPAAPGLAGNLVVDAAGSAGPLRIVGMRSTASRGHGIVIRSAPSAGVRILNDTISGSAGIGVLTLAPAGAGDSIAGVQTAGNAYPARTVPMGLPAFFANDFTGNVRDTLQLEGGALSVPAILPDVPGVPWRVLGDIDITGGALTVAADTVSFDDSVEVRVGGAQPGGLRAVGTGPTPKLFTATPGHPTWWGILYQNVAPGGAAPFTMLQNVIVEKAGHFAPCFGDCGPTPFSGLRFYNQSTENVTFDSIVVRQAVAYALDVQPPGSSVLTVLNSQFYANSYTPMIRAAVPLALIVDGTDLYHYGAQAIQPGFAGIDSVSARNNWWGDVAGPNPGYYFQDSLGRASFDNARVAFVPFATAPHFPAALGPPASLVATQDTFVGFPALSSSDSVRVRTVDGVGRGVPGPSVSWTTIPPGQSTVSPTLALSDLGGRADVLWQFSTSAGQQIAQATGVGAPVRYIADVRPGPTDPATVDWQVLAALTVADSVHSHPGIGTDTVFYSSTDRSSAFKTFARDGFGNVTQPNFGPIFDQGLCASFACRFPAADSVKGDTVYFRPPAIGNYVISGLYESGAGGSDLVVLRVTPVAAGVQIDRDTAVFTSLCPVGGPCVSQTSEREFHAFVVDSGGTPIGNASARFQWLAPAFPDTVITLDQTRGAPANDSATVSAHAEGTSWLVAVDTASGSVTFTERDSMPILVQQVGYFIVITPDSASVLIGNTTTFQATVVDAGNQPLVGDTVHWRFDQSQPGKLTIVDTSVFNQVTVRMDSTPIGSTFLTGFWGRPLADTAFGYSPFDTLLSFAAVFNPVQTPIAVGGNPYQVAVNPVTNRVYVSNVGTSEVAVLDGANDAVLTVVNVGGPTTVAAVNPKANRYYVAQITTLGSRLLALSGATNSVVDTTGGGAFRPSGMAVDTARNRVYVTGNSCFFDPQQVTLVCNPIGEVQLMALNGDSLGEVLASADSTPGQARGMAYSSVTDRIYVAVSTGSVDTVKVIDAASLTVIDSIEVGSGAYGVAVNPVTNRIYVTNETDGTLSVIDGATNTVIATVFLGFLTFPEGLGVDPNTNRIYVSEAGVSVMRVIDGVTNTEIGQIFVGGFSTDAQPNPVTGRFYVPVYESGVVKAFRY